MAQTFVVRGMACEHCSRAVTGELQRVAGVESVQVDLSTGRVLVRAGRTLSEAEVAKAVDEAGYELVVSDGSGHDAH